MKPIVLNHNKMSGPERAHADTLAVWKAAGEIIDFIYEPFRIILADKTTYAPDFLVVYADRFEIHEVKAGTKEKLKGKWTGKYIPFSRGDESLTKLKICARLFPWWKFRLYWYYRNTFGMREISGR